MNAYEDFRYEMLKKVKPDYSTHFKVGVLTNNYPIPESHICEQLQEMAAARLISLTAWDGQRESSWDEWPDPDSFFYNRTDSAHVRIRLLSAGGELLAG